MSSPVQCPQPLLHVIRLKHPHDTVEKTVTVQHLVSSHAPSVHSMTMPNIVMTYAFMFGSAPSMKAYFNTMFGIVISYRIIRSMLHFVPWQSFQAISTLPLLKPIMHLDSQTCFVSQAWKFITQKSTFHHIIEPTQETDLNSSTTTNLENDFRLWIRM